LLSGALLGWWPCRNRSAHRTITGRLGAIGIGFGQSGPADGRFHAGLHDHPERRSTHRRSSKAVAESRSCWAAARSMGSRLFTPRNIRFPSGSISPTGGIWVRKGPVMTAMGGRQPAGPPFWPGCGPLPHELGPSASNMPVRSSEPASPRRFHAIGVDTVVIRRAARPAAASERAQFDAMQHGFPHDRPSESASGGTATMRRTKPTCSTSMPSTATLSTSRTAIDRVSPASHA